MHESLKRDRLLTNATIFMELRVMEGQYEAGNRVITQMECRE